MSAPLTGVTPHRTQALGVLLPMPDMPRECIDMPRDASCREVIEPRVISPEPRVAGVAPPWLVPELDSLLEDKCSADRSSSRSFSLRSRSVSILRSG